MAENTASFQLPELMSDISAPITTIKSRRDYRPDNPPENELESNFYIGDSLFMDSVTVADPPSSSSTIEDPETPSGDLIYNIDMQHLIVDNLEEMEKKENWINKQFATPDDLEQFYTSYAHQKGFSVRCQYRTKRKINGQSIAYYVKFVCNKEGFRRSSDQVRADDAQTKDRREKRVGCGAFIYSKYDVDRAAYLIDKWVVQHDGHVLHSPEFSHMHRSSRSISSVQQHIAQMNSNAGIPLRSSYELMALNAGGKEHLGFLHVDLKNHLGSRRQKSMMHGEATALLEYFRMRAANEMYFFHEVEVDSKEQVANIFWADRRMRMDYKCFGDAICFDTTFKTNKNYRPLALFVGYDNHRMGTIFGAALLFDEIADSFQWLFKTFLRCMDGQAPLTIFTDQDKAIAKAITSEFKDTSHCLCTWHILENAKKNLSRLYTPTVANSLFYLMKDVDTEEEFDYEWKLMIQDSFDSVEHKWLTKIHESRTKWSSAWVKQHFTAGMITTQMVESFNSIIRRYLQPDDNLLQFFAHFDNLLDGRRHKVAMVEFDSKDKRRKNKNRCNPLLNSAEVYTHCVYEKFQKEYDQSADYDMLLQMDNEQPTDRVRQYNVYRPSNTDPSLKLDERTVHVRNPNIILSCSCRLYETAGLFCRHLLRVLDALRIFEGEEFKVLPTQYIMKRWTVHAREGLDSFALPITGCPDGENRQTLDKIKCKLLDLANEASFNTENLLLLENVIGSIRSKIRQGISTNVATDVQPPTSKSVVTTIKMKKDPRRTKNRWKKVSEVVRMKKKAIFKRMEIDLNKPAQ